MKVVHISATPLAGSPIRIVNALNKHTDVKARSVNLDPAAYGTLTFPEDLTWKQNRAEAESLIAEADIIHFHHWFDFGSDKNPFGFNFIRHMKPGAKHLMHWHSNPLSLAEGYGLNPRTLVEADVPQMVVAQFHEPYYPNALPVPLIVEVESARPALAQRDKPVFFFSPSRPRHAYEDRWETKGKPEIVALLTGAKNKGILDFRVEEKLPFHECMQARSESDVVIDDLITGSFHTTSLEALAIGRPTLSYVDSRTQLVLSELTQSTDLPLINVRYKDASEVIEALARDKSLREEIGKFSRDWMLANYSEKKMAQHYVDGYQQLINDGKLSNKRYQSHRRAKLWLYNDVPDFIWRSRKGREKPHIIVPGDLSKLKFRIKNLARQIQSWIYSRD